jgi:hypothetical protein
MDKCYSNYYGLIFRCPVDMELKSCAFNKIRDLPSKERIGYYNALTEEEKNVLIEIHQDCLNQREKRNCFTIRNKGA